MKFVGLILAEGTIILSLSSWPTESRSIPIYNSALFEEGRVTWSWQTQQQQLNHVMIRAFEGVIALIFFLLLFLYPWPYIGRHLRRRWPFIGRILHSPRRRRHSPRFVRIILLFCATKNALSRAQITHDQAVLCGSADPLNRAVRFAGFSIWSYVFFLLCLFL